MAEGPEALHGHHTLASRVSHIKDELFCRRAKAMQRLWQTGQSFCSSRQPDSISKPAASAWSIWAAISERH